MKERIDKNIKERGCESCRALRWYEGMNTRECRYTPRGVRSFTNCPCQECLLKTMCEDQCDEFMRTRIECYKNYHF